MHGIPIDQPAASPPDRPAPGEPLPGDEPTIELPVVTAEMLAADTPTSTPTLANAALTMALTRPTKERRFPALVRLGPPPGPPAEPLPPPASNVSDTDFAAGTAPAASFATKAAPEAGFAAWAATGAGFAAAGTEPAAHFATRAAAAEEAPAGDPPPPGRRWLIGAGIAAAALLLTGATVVALSGDGDGPEGVPPAAAVAAHTATAALAGRTSAGFDLVDGAKQVSVRAADLGESLYRVTTPDSGRVVPRAEEQDGRVRLRLDGDAQSVDVVLNSAVLWTLRVAGGAELSTIDLSAGRIGGVDLTGGASRIDLTLPRPDGTLLVRMSGGVSLFDVRTTDQIPVRVRVGSGAGQVTLNGQQHGGVAAGQTFTPASWEGAADRVDVDAAAGMATLTVAPY